MNSKPHSYPGFLLALILLLGFGSILTELPYPALNVFTILGLYALGLAFQQWFFDDRFFSNPDRVGKREEPDDEDRIIYAGEPLETEDEASREKAALEGVLTLGAQIRLRLAAGAMLGIVGFFVVKGQLHVHNTLVIHLLAAMMIIPAVALNHLIIPMVLNVLAVSYGLISPEHPHWSLYVCYLLLFLHAIIVFQNNQREIRQSKPRSFELARVQMRVLLNALRLSLLFVLVCGIVEHFVPQSAKGSGKARSSRLQTGANEVKAMFGKAMGKSNESATASPSGVPSFKANGEGLQRPDSVASAAPSAGSNDVAQKVPAPKAGLSGEGSGGKRDLTPPTGFPSGLAMPSFKPENLEKLAREAIKAGAFDEKKLKESGIDLKPEISKLLTPENLKAAQNILKKMAENSRQEAAAKQGATGPAMRPTRLAEKGPGGDSHLDSNQALLAALKATQTAMNEAIAKAGTNSGLGTTSADGASGSGTLSANSSSGSSGGSSSKQELGEASGGTSGATGSSGASSGSGGTASEGEGKTESGSGSLGGSGTGSGGGRDAGGPSPKPKPKELVSTDSIDSFTLILIAAILIAAYLFRRKLKKQADPNKITRQQLAREQRQQLLKQLNSLNNARLSPREEVIARYDLYCRILEMANTPRELSLPPTDFQRRIRYLHPPLAGQSLRITDTFCDTLYGDFSVPLEKLAPYRTAVQEVFHYFTH